MKFKKQLIHGRLVKRYKRFLADPAYGKVLDVAIRNGVEVIVIQARVSPESIDYHRTLPVEM